MITIILFTGGLAVVGGLGYLAVRPLIFAHWEHWQKERAEVRAMQQREQRRLTLREEATASVLKQIAQQEETRRQRGRKAA